MGLSLGSVLLLGTGGGLIGFLLSVLGAGGSILLLPLLVSGAGLPTREAVPLSLLVVMLLALILGIPALAGSWIGGSWVKACHIPEPVQLAVFAMAALVASWLLNRRPPGRAGGDTPAEQPLRLALQGVLVGLLTGIAGVGGGFAIVPALVLLAGLPMALASGTSLLLLAGMPWWPSPPRATGPPPACRCCCPCWAAAPSGPCWASAWPRT